MNFKFAIVGLPLFFVGLYAMGRQINYTCNVLNGPDEIGKMNFLVLSGQFSRNLVHLIT